MIHDELLAEISCYDPYYSEELQNALSAVVELHRPALDKEMNEFAEDGGRFGCAGCGFDFNFGTWEVSYPCRTIQAIQKELE